MDPVLLLISRASLELGLLHAKLLARAASSAVSPDERDEIALHVPLISSEKRDLDRLFNARAADHTAFPEPTKATLDSLHAATAQLSEAIAKDATTAMLVGLAGGLLKAGASLRG